MKKLIPIIILSALMLIGCNDDTGTSFSDTSAETSVTTISKSEMTTAEQEDKTTSTSKFSEDETQTATTTKKSDKHSEPSTTTSKSAQHGSQDMHSDITSLSSEDEPTVTEKADTQTTSTQATEDTPSEMLPKNDEPIELPIIPIG